MEIDVTKCLFQSMDLFWNGKRHTQTLDYFNIPFRCARCHDLGHVFKDRDKSLVRKAWRRKGSISSESYFESHFVTNEAYY
jgi:hypothetical protein